jgi:hypothetical protein
MNKIVSCWSLSTLPNGDQLAEFCRPQDWGDPRYMYAVYRLEANGYENECHCWLDHHVSPYEHLVGFSSLLVIMFLPGLKREFCGREFMANDDFWDDSWGEMPPFVKSDEDNYDDD